MVARLLPGAGDRLWVTVIASCDPRPARLDLRPPPSHVPHGGNRPPRAAGRRPVPTATNRSIRSARPFARLRLRPAEQRRGCADPAPRCPRGGLGEPPASAPLPAIAAVPGPHPHRLAPRGG